MFDSLSERLNHSLKQITGQATLNEDNIKASLKEVRMALLEADVALSVVTDFIDRIKEKAIGAEVMSSLNPGQSFIKIVQEELEYVLGGSASELNLATKPPAVILVAGLQGAGKTTTVGKLSKWLQETKRKKVMVVSADVYRPAAIKQLETLASDVGALFCDSNETQQPVEIVEAAIKSAKIKFADVLIVDTAGRLHVDADMMDEIKQVHAVANPIETLFVVDAMTGQDAANTAKAFNEALPLTGVVLTKVDADTRGGAALSVKQITGKPIKFLGVGEKTKALEIFHPERIASRILGMGDVLSLIEQAEQQLDKKKAEKLAKKIVKGKDFTLEDFKDQLQQMKNMGGMGAMLDKLPGMNANMLQAAQEQIGGKQFAQMEAIIDSMTPKERQNPSILNGSRKRRITQGSGTQLQDLNRLIKQHKQMQKMMKKMKGKGMMNMMRGLGGMMPKGSGMSRR
ncbi:MAG: signal recognition particle protein [Pseudomonadota bacterium]